MLLKIVITNEVRDLFSLGIRSISLAAAAWLFKQRAGPSGTKVPQDDKKIKAWSARLKVVP
jgi:hypothetical protein